MKANKKWMTGLLVSALAVGMSASVSASDGNVNVTDSTVTTPAVVVRYSLNGTAKNAELPEGVAVTYAVAGMDELPEGVSYAEAILATEATMLTDAIQVPEGTIFMEKLVIED